MNFKVHNTMEFLHVFFGVHLPYSITLPGLLTDGVFRSVPFNQNVGIFEFHFGSQQNQSIPTL